MLLLSACNWSFWHQRLQMQLGPWPHQVRFFHVTNLHMMNDDQSAHLRIRQSTIIPQTTKTYLQFRKIYSLKLRIKDFCFRGFFKKNEELKRLKALGTRKVATVLRGRLKKVRKEAKNLVLFLWQNLGRSWCWFSRREIPAETYRARGK